jgi:PPOX class probable F420-dependent enzyme
MTLPESAKELTRSGALGHLVTIDPDGSPQITCVWVKVDGDELVTAHLAPSQRKLANVRRDPRVAISFEGTRRRPAHLPVATRPETSFRHHRGLPTQAAPNARTRC